MKRERERRERERERERREKRKKKKRKKKNDWGDLQEGGEEDDNNNEWMSTSHDRMQPQTPITHGPHAWPPV